MKSLAASIMSASACQNDLANGNALPNQALTGFNNYDIMRAAACQKDATTSQVRRWKKIPQISFKTTNKFSFFSILFCLTILMPFFDISSVLLKLAHRPIVHLSTSIIYR